MPELCQLPAKVGTCKAAIPRFFYNKQTNECEQFIYGGCDANDNNFITLKDCQTCCGGDHNCMCSLPPKSGPCEALIHRFYYDSASRECIQFNYGGCQPNANNFKTIEECISNCAQNDLAQ